MEALTVSQEPVVEETVVTSTENSTENINTTDNVTEEQTTSAETPKPMEKKLPSFTNKEGVRMIKLGRASAGHETAFLLTGDMMVLGWKSKAMSLKFGQFNILSLEKMTRLEVGQNTPVFLKWKSKHASAESRSLSIIYPDPANLAKEKTLDLVCPTEDIFTYVHTTLAQTMSDVAEDRLDVSPDSEIARGLWRKHDKMRTGCVSWDTVIVILETFGLKGTACVKRLFNTFDSDNDGKLRYKEYMKFIKKVTLRPELDTLWTMIVKNEKIRKKFKRPMELKADKTTESYDTISLGQFTTFWREYMGEFITETAAQRIFVEAFPELITSNQDKNTVRITQAMWRVAVSNPTNDIFNPNKIQRHMEMSYPLAQYMIFASFQTYALVHKEKVVRKVGEKKKPKSPRVQLYAPGAAFLYKNVVDPLIQKVKQSSPMSKADSKDGAASPAAQMTTRESVGMGVRPDQLGDEEDLIPEEDDIPPAESTDPAPEPSSPTEPIPAAPETPTQMSLEPVSPGAGDGNELVPASPREEEEVEVFSEVSLDRYRADLLRGCRYIEIDVVDGVKEPVVCMGLSILTVKEILELVRDIAFKKSSYPLIIGVGVFCSTEYQKKLAFIFKATLKEKLIDPQLDPFGPEDSPDRLKGRILLLHKNTTVEQLAKQEATAPAAQSLVINTEAIKSPLTAGDKVAGGNLSPSATVQGKSPVSLLGRLSSFSLSPTRSNDGNDTPRSFVTVSSNTQTALITQEEMSSDLFKLFALSSKHVGDKQKLENAELRDGTVLSFTEETMLTAGASKELTLYNHTNLSRVFSANTRSNRDDASNNFNPCTAWANGVQLVCVNFDSMDKHAQVAIGRFEENAGSGYLLKPQYLRPKEKYQARIAKYTFDAVAGLMTPPPPMKLTINVISAQQLPPLSIKRVPDDVPALPTSPTSPTSPASPTSPTATTADPTTNPTTNPTADPTTDPTAPTTTIVTPIVTDAEIVTVPVMNPLVRVTLHDNQGDGAGFSTDVVMDNFFNPVWNKVFTFNVCNSEIAVLNFEILHESADDYFDENGNNCGKKRQLIAFSSLPVRCMREGLRLCKLYDQDGCRGEGLVASTLLVRTLIEVEDDANTGKKEDASASTEEKDD